MSLRFNRTIFKPIVLKLWPCSQPTELWPYLAAELMGEARNTASQQTILLFIVLFSRILIG
jgi:hypothetical protein